jgi:ethanolamine utilization protein EutA
MHDFPHPHEHEDHEGEPPALPDEADPVWAGERIELRSVGIDIGSSTSHLTFSRLVLRRFAGQLSSRFRVVQRDVLAQSPILLTPYRGPVLIDTERVDAFIRDAYAGAGLTPGDIDTGAVVITGEAAKKENAESILPLFAREAGRFVCAAAGPQLEAIMAAHGSGAVARSRGGGAVLNIDIGGGTTKLAICRDGEVAAVAVINIGGRLVADDGGRVIRLEEAGAAVGDAVGVRLELGQRIDEAAKTALAQRMATCLFEVIDRRPLSALARRLMHTPPLGDDGPVDVLMFSGGVSEYIYDRERAIFGDLGRALGEAVRNRLGGHPLAAGLVTPLEGIRATVIGAAQYTVQVSGSTIFTPQPHLLPIRNLPVLSVRLEEPLSVANVAEAVRQAARGYDADFLGGPLAFAIRWPFGPSHGELTALGRGLIQALDGRRAPVVLAFDRDIARLVGGLMLEELGATFDLVAVDELELGAFDYIDVGEPLAVSGVVPVVIKSLVFRPPAGADIAG